ncbi:hypothetical protein NRF20_26740 [Streptomyces sp. R-74717]|uniref:hypothetical protein n=1 Tax=Streptomyces sp. R-74717 TaxID=2969820 RepID=UPI0039B5141E
MRRSSSRASGVKALRQPLRHTGEFGPLDRESDESAPPPGRLEAGGPDPSGIAAERQFALRVLDQRPSTGQRGNRLLGVPGDGFPGAWQETLALLVVGEREAGPVQGLFQLHVRGVGEHRQRGETGTDPGQQVVGADPGVGLHLCGGLRDAQRLKQIQAQRVELQSR